jgi:hypothetical protein
VDPRHAFSGHAICEQDAWLNGLSSPIIESYHPNAAGHLAYKRLLVKAFLQNDRLP